MTRYRRVRVDLLPDTPFDLEVDGSLVPVDRIAQRFSRENDFTGIGPLSDLSRALVVPIAVASAPAFAAFVAPLPGGEAEPSVDPSSSEAEIPIPAIFRIRLRSIFAKVVAIVLFPVTALSNAALCAFCRKNPTFNAMIPGVKDAVNCKNILAICDIRVPTHVDVARELNRLAIQPSQLRILVDAIRPPSTTPPWAVASMETVSFFRSHPPIPPSSQRRNPT